MRLINEDDVLSIVERVTNEAVEKKQPKYLIQPRIIAEIAGLPTIEAEPCTFCAYNPPSSCDGKPCTICPAHKRSGDSE